jgi:hypothetical protein
MFGDEISIILQGKQTYTSPLTDTNDYSIKHAESHHGEKEQISFDFHWERQHLWYAVTLPSHTQDLYPTSHRTEPEYS